MYLSWIDYIILILLLSKWTVTTLFLNIRSVFQYFLLVLVFIKGLYDRNKIQHRSFLWVMEKWRLSRRHWASGLVRILPSLFLGHRWRCIFMVRCLSITVSERNFLFHAYFSFRKSSLHVNRYIFDNKILHSKIPFYWQC